ncbi:MAG TPA: hypothetical protein VFY73_15485 [Ideonella sp.]|uniref:tetratricopeptide repeat protein n=1 Tax=Ideonella sp. TaxID=1929293 RepID=UPI002E3363D1|nr:hypothetical protein [Ideonella sp.]HEX5685422.1 hypothetical protein [Ideonella sp.]
MPTVLSVPSVLLLRLACVAACTLVPTLQAADNAAAPAAVETARPSVGAVLNEAKALISSGQGAQASAKLQTVEALGPLNPYEAFMLQRLRGAAALQESDLTRAQAAFEAVLAAQRLTPAEQLQTMSSLGQTLYRAKDFPAAAKWLQRYAEAGGTDAEVLALRAPAAYFSKDHATARTLLQAAIKADADASRPTPLTTWRLLASSQRQLGDDAGYRQSLRRMAVQHPQPAFWAELVQHELGEPSAWPERQLLDVQRLLRAAGALGGADNALILAAQAQQAGFPGEAVQVIDEALAQPGVTPQQMTALTQRRDAARRQAEADRRNRARDEADARQARDGQALVTLGWAWVTEGQADAGLPLITQGLQRGGLKRADEARLHHGMALALAGQATEARQALAQVKGEPALVALAGLWADFAERRTTATP